MGSCVARRFRYWGWIYFAEAGARGFQISEADTGVALETLLAPDALVPWSSDCCRLESGSR